MFLANTNSIDGSAKGRVNWIKQSNISHILRVLHMKVTDIYIYKMTESAFVRTSRKHRLD